MISTPGGYSHSEGDRARCCGTARHVVGMEKRTIVSGKKCRNIGPDSLQVMSHLLDDLGNADWQGIGEIEESSQIRHSLVVLTCPLCLRLIDEAQKGES